MHVFVRLPIALSMLGHGLVRLPKLHEFSSWMVETMHPSMLPETFVQAWGYALPPLEAAIGLWLITGWQVRWAIVTCLALLSVLVAGSCAIENWGAVQAQLVHGIYLMVLFWFTEMYLKGKKKQG